MAIVPLSAAFRSSYKSECYLFVKDEFVVVNYDDKKELVSRPSKISEGFNLPANTVFQNGIDCAFETTGDEAFIFFGKYCAKINFAPHSSDAEMITATKLIRDMFPCLKQTPFEKGIQSAIRSIGNQVFLFKDGSYARIDYQSGKLLSNRTIRDGFRSLVGTVFENGIDTAFHSHNDDEAYIFKGEYYALLNVAQNTASGDFIVGGRIKIILEDWASLKHFLSSEN